jgi:hypothetical protein
MSASYQASKTPLKFKVSKGSPKPTKVLSSGSGADFVPRTCTSKPGQSIAGKPGKMFHGKGTKG